MLKKCKVILQNECVCVAEYEDILIQFPPLIDKHLEYVYVECLEDKYFIVEENGAKDSTPEMEADLAPEEKCNEVQSTDSVINKKKKNNRF